MRSWLFVPGDSERKLDKALQSGADALIVDLEDSVALDAKADARAITASFLKSNRGVDGPALYVRVNALDTKLTAADLSAVMPCAPKGIMLPKALGLEAGLTLSQMLDDEEARCGLEPGVTRFLPLITETAASVLAIRTWCRPLPRLSGLTWGAEDLSADLGIAKPRDSDGAYTSVFRHARTMTIVAAGACETEAIDTVYIDFRDADGLRRECEEAARDGFSGKLAIHPGQVPVINEVFTVSETDLAEARAIIAAFAEHPEAGVVGIGGKMVDRPHLRRAERIVAKAERL